MQQTSTNDFATYVEHLKEHNTKLDRMIYLLEHVYIRDDEDRTRAISSSMPIIVDYLNRRSVLLFTPVALTLTLEDAGTISVPANSWTDISFPAGTRIYASNLTNQVQVLIRATDRTFFTSASSSSGGGGSFNLAQFGGSNVTIGQQVMGNSLPVTIASNQTSIPVSGTVTSQTGASAVNSGLNNFHLISAASNNATLVKAAPGNIYSIVASNSTTADAFLKIFNKSSVPVPGTDTPYFTFDLGGAAVAGQNNPAVVTFNTPMQMTVGIGIALVTGNADLNNVAVAAAQCTLDLQYA